MPEPLRNRVIALAEGRQADELAALVEKEGAQALRCPMLSILDAPDQAAVIAWLRELVADRFAHVILMTGEAWRRLLAAAERQGLRAEVVAAAGRTRFVTRGPKPVRALKEVGLAPALSAQPATTEGVVATLRGLDLRGQTVGLTLYGVPNPPLVQYLEEAGATVKQVLPYVYAPAADAERVAELIRGLAAGSVDALLFTSSPQVERLFEVARERDLEGPLREGLARTCVAAVGPVVADKLQELGIRPDVCPEQGFVMKNLVALLSRHLAGTGK
jgi:uroporphyrinogen-III synthase